VSSRSLANGRIGIVIQGDPADPGSWSGIPRGLSDGLRESGADPVPIDARAPGLTRLAEHLRVSWTRQTTNKLLAWIGGRRASRALANAQAVAAIALGSGFELAIPIPIATYDDMTVVQALAQPNSEYDGIPEGARQRWTERQRRGYEASRACCVASSWAAASIIEDYGIDPAKVHVVGAGRNSPLRKLERDWSVPRFVFIGRDWERKQGQRVVETFAAVRGVHRASTLDLVGGHPPIEAPGVTGHGPQPLNSPSAQRLIAELLGRATCLVLPSKLEPFGIAHLEAGAAGVPSIGTTNGGAATAVGGGGVLVDPDDEDALLEAMLHLCDPQVAKSLGERAFEHSRGFSWQAVAERVVSALDKARYP
jgi:glycosyltransferase involved in cell wall biosynthesis